MKTKLPLALAAGMLITAGLGACSSNSAPEPDKTGTPIATTAAPTPTSTAKTGTASSVKASCELFNSLYQEYATVPAGDSKAYESIYLKSEDAKRTTTGDIRGLFSALSLIAIDRSGASGTAREPEQASTDALRDAVFANAGACSSEGVTLRL